MRRTKRYKRIRRRSRKIKYRKRNNRQKGGSNEEEIMNELRAYVMQIPKFTGNTETQNVQYVGQSPYFHRLKTMISSLPPENIELYFNKAFSTTNQTVINTLCWNICWGCMMANETSKFDKTAFTLADKCKQLNQGGNNVCLNNVVSLINSKNYNFVGLQEAANWEIIYNTINHDSLGYVHHSVYNPDKKVYVDLATFYDKTQYKVLAVKSGDILTSKWDNRPYHIIFLLNTMDNKYYIVVNLHNGHGISQDILEHRLSDDIENGYMVHDTTEISIRMGDGTTSAGVERTNISDVINGKQFDTIVMGDFNDHGNFNYWRHLTPFKYTSFPNINTIVVGSGKQPPLTCCTGSRSIRTDTENWDRMYGDYILINASENFYYSNEVNIPKGFLNPSSDHTPVEAQIVSGEKSILSLNDIKQYIGASEITPDKYALALTIYLMLLPFHVTVNNETYATISLQSASELFNSKRRRTV